MRYEGDHRGMGATGTLQRSSKSALSDVERRLLAIGAATSPRAAAFALRAVGGYRLGRKVSTGVKKKGASGYGMGDFALVNSARNPNQDADGTVVDLDTGRVFQDPSTVGFGYNTLVPVSALSVAPPGPAVSGGVVSTPSFPSATPTGGGSGGGFQQAANNFLDIFSSAAKAAPAVINDVNLARGKAPYVPPPRPYQAPTSGVGLAVGLGLLGLAALGGIALAVRGGGRPAAVAQNRRSGR